MHSEYHYYRKVVGIAGIRCPCCNNFHKGRSLKATKQRINRALRRKEKGRKLGLEETEG